jgi:plastocyanin
MRRALLLSIVAVALCLCHAPRLAAQSSVRAICIGAASGNPGARVTVPVTLDNGASVAAFQVDIGYDTTLLSLADARLGPDAPASMGWTLESQLLAPGLVRVLAYSIPPAGLPQGLKTVAFVDLDVSSALPLSNIPFPLTNCVLGDASGAGIPCGSCLQPGIDGASPRFAVSLVDDSFSFHPPRLLVEPDDWVLWRNVGSTRFHTTTSGVNCTAGGLWRGELPPGGQFGRLFVEPPGQVLPYFSEPDCLAGMTGEVDMTARIELTLEDVSGAAVLSWTGGSGLYRIVRSDGPGLIGPSSVSFAPTGGDAGTTFTDAAPVGVGGAHFYLVVDKY